MDGRAFLDSARQLLAAPGEANWRSAMGRCYFALLNEAQAALERWGFPLPAGADAHAFVTGRFDSAMIVNLLSVKIALTDLYSLTQEADRALRSPGSFADVGTVTQQFFLAVGLIGLLDQIESDPNQRATAVADIKARWP
jgi:hypothetical protein